MTWSTPSFTTITFYLIVLRTNPFEYNIDSMSYGGVHLSKSYTKDLHVLIFRVQISYYSLYIIFN
jgi:hypothetical protein